MGLFFSEQFLLAKIKHFLMFLVLLGVSLSMVVKQVTAPADAAQISTACYSGSS